MDTIPSATELAALYRARKLSPVEVTRAALARIRQFDPLVNAFVLTAEESALAAARASEQRLMQDRPLGPLDGIPATVKDNIVAKGWPTRKGSLTTDASPAAEDAPAVARMREQGAVFLGKTTLPEFGWIGACHSPLSGITRNPWKLDRTTGGSSGGAAAAALLNMGSLHLGTDGAGSIRIPSAFTGVFGIKPSYGRVPAHPASPFTVLAHQGPLTRTVADAALMLSVISQPDLRDMTAWNSSAPDFSERLDEGVSGLRLAWSPRLGYVKHLDAEIAAATEKAARMFESLGAHVEETDPGFSEPLEIIRVIWGGVSAAIVGAVPPPLAGKVDPGFARVAAEGAKVTLPQYLAAMQARAELALHMMNFHRHYDLLLTPQMPIGAIEAGRVTPADGRFGEEWINWSPYTYPFNLTQQPAASVPCGLTSEGLPIALQIVAGPRRDHLVLRAARAFEKARPFVMLDAPRQS
ncbi:MAG TPA: amidase [Pseudorhodoplanes sp.]|jgi:aspartyl-tRNA(Asn)/glutamyl-tRNA(Gln) amidotransferase subunit A|nr:amidase [Pseudorhodoplanes sp.]